MIFKVFRKPDWQHRDPVIRARSVARSDDPELIAVLREIAVEDEEPHVRTVALRRIDDLGFVQTRIDEDPDEQLTRAARQHLMNLLLGDEVPLNERVAFATREPSRDRLKELATRAEAAAVRQAAIRRLDAQGLLGDIVINDPDEETRKLALSRVEQSSTLQRVAEALRKKDKQFHALVNEQLQAMEDEADEATATRESAQSLCESAEELARGASVDDRAAELESLTTAWAALQLDDDHPLQKRFAGAVAIIERALEMPEPVDTTDEKTDSDTADIPETESSAATQAEKPESAKNQQKGSEPGDNRDSSKETLEQAAQRLEQALEQLQSAIEDKDLQTARKVYPSVQSARDKAAHFSRFQHSPAHRSLLKAEARLRELRDWQHWSNNQIRKDLIQAVLDLPANAQHPDAVIAGLKKARARWDSLDESERWPGDRRRHGSPVLWKQFNKACESVFEQAKPYFEKRDEIRGQKFDEIEDLSKELQSLADAENVQIKTLQQKKREAIKELKSLNELPAKLRGKAAGLLRGALDAASETLKRHNQSIEKEKLKLIREAEQLAYSDDPASAMETAKQLQQRWQRAGSLPRKHEQKLWERFRAPIDPLFEAQAAERKAEQADREEQQAQQKALIEELETLLDSADSLVDKAGQVEGLQQRWQALGRGHRKLAQQFDQLVEQFEQQSQEQAQARAQADRQRWWQKLSLLRDAEASLLEEKPLQDAFDNWPEPDAKTANDRALNNRRAHLEAGKTPDGNALEENTGKARRLCVQLEFMAGLDSPDSDEELRMDIQVQRLSQSLAGGRSESQLEEAEVLESEWFSLGPLQPRSATALDQRTTKAINSLIKEYQ